MKKLLLSLLLCAFAFSFSPVAMAAVDVTSSTSELPFFKKNKKSSSKARYRKIKRNKQTFSLKSLLSSRNKKPLSRG
ncbi:hypothetical protein [Rufibacter radiotolerans]|uniref:hypothetical protein n=1 Tax=Rufibacter radiotolerans TaxID=1379910 RepID=UPI000AC764AC|nr:hypothetical protein [Rufibacter radiotolerans]